MTRTELFRLVWERPRSRLGPELGLSDVGLTKLCRRHDIPLPPQGHWVRVELGRAESPPNLPRPEHDPVVVLPSEHQVRRERQRKMEREAVRALERKHHVDNADVAKIRGSLQGCHTLVQATAEYFKKTAERVGSSRRAVSRALELGQPAWGALAGPANLHGRWAPTVGGCLRIVATFENIDWILRFNDALLRGLISKGCTIKCVEWNRRTWRVTATYRGGSADISFYEGFERLPSSAKAKQMLQPQFRATAEYSLRLKDHIRQDKCWDGNQQVLSTRLATIIEEALAWLESSGEIVRLRAEQEEQRKAADQRRADEKSARLAAEQLRQRRLASQAQQCARALKTKLALEEFIAIQQLLAVVEARALPDDKAVFEWIALVKARSADPIDGLLKEIRAEAESEAGPLWWPTLTSEEENRNLSSAQEDRAIVIPSSAPTVPSASGPSSGQATWGTDGETRALLPPWRA